DTRTEHYGLCVRSGVERHVPPAANQNIVRCRVPSLDSKIAAVHDWKVLQPEADVDVQFTAHLPIVANVIALLRLTSPHGIVELIGLSHGTGQPKQERSVGIEIVR